MAAVAPLSGVISDRVGSRLLGSIGLVVLAVGLCFCQGWGLSSLPGDAVALAVTGLGTGVFISPNSSALMGSAPRRGRGSPRGYWRGPATSAWCSVWGWPAPSSRPCWPARRRMSPPQRSSPPSPRASICWQASRCWGRWSPLGSRAILAARVSSAVWSHHALLPATSTTPPGECTAAGRSAGRCAFSSCGYWQ